MATTTMPATTHALPHAQRIRLMRSTRKLGSLLGETPLLVESAPSATDPFTPSHSRSASVRSTDSKRSGRILPRSSSLALSAAPPAAISQATEHSNGHAPSSLAPPVSRPMLFLRLAPGAGGGVSGESSPAERSPLPSPLSPTFALNSPGTPPVDASRRRKMAKLVRTLGENVPPELVFPDKARRRASTLSVPESAHEQRRRMAHLAQSEDAYMIDVVEDEGPFSYPSTIPVVREAPARASCDTVLSNTDSVGSRELLMPHDRLVPTGGNGMRRREDREGWSGEWGGNVANMDDVVRSLRGLKMKCWQRTYAGRHHPTFVAALPSARFAALSHDQDAASAIPPSTPPTP
ncbi:hypothetical protein C8R43DRAFT_1121208 [Mycena crocata]|nr:hypothetical protein C8R43DRAFT_1121208 [Mycena crocata]